MPIPQQIFSDLNTIREQLHVCETYHPNSPHVVELHNRMLYALRTHGGDIGMSKDQINELSMPQGGGTPKDV